eukprot:scaffold7050_cov181-Amphora_coffeaeformis.AAC.1
MGLLRWLEEQKNDTRYCVWQASPQSLELPSMERNANIIFNEETIDGTTTKTDLTEMCQDVIKEYQQEVENLKMKKEQNLFIACAWMTNKERMLFWLFSHVVKVDVSREPIRKSSHKGTNNGLKVYS